MASELQDYQLQFNLNYNQYVESNSLMNLMRRTPDQIEFHLECIKSTMDYENARILLPNPCMYIPEISKCYVKEILSDIVFLFKILTKAASIPEATDKYYFNILPDLMKLIYFIIFTSPLTLDLCPLFEGSVYMVKCSHEKEKQFAEREGEMDNYVSYLYHATRPQSVFSICRNGIKAMAGTQFCRNGSSYGKGIYMSEDNNGGYGSLVLMYAVKNAESSRRTDRTDIFVFRSEKDVILRAILWKPSCHINRDILIDIIQQTQFY